MELRAQNNLTLKRLLQKALKNATQAREAMLEIEERELFSKFPEDLDLIASKLTDIIGDGEKSDNEHLGLQNILDHGMD